MAKPKIAIRLDNPKKAGSASYARYECYKAASTYDEFLILGGSKADYKHDLAKGFIHVEEESALNQTPHTKMPAHIAKTITPLVRAMKRSRDDVDVTPSEKPDSKPTTKDGAHERAPNDGCDEKEEANAEFKSEVRTSHSDQRSAHPRSHPSSHVLNMRCKFVLVQQFEGLRQWGCIIRGSRGRRHMEV